MYSIDEIGNLPPDLAAYKAAEKSDNNTIAFHGELSPCSNFHLSPSVGNNEKFHSAEQCIQYQKSLLFGDSYTANLILCSDSALECKRLPSKMI